MQPRLRCKRRRYERICDRDLLNGIANLAGHPGLNIPCGFDPDGMPLCVQIVGSAFDEQAVLDFGMSYQDETDWHLIRPEYPWRR